VVNPDHNAVTSYSFPASSQDESGVLIDTSTSSSYHSQGDTPSPSRGTKCAKMFSVNHGKKLGKSSSKVDAGKGSEAQLTRNAVKARGPHNMWQCYELVMHAALGKAHLEIQRRHNSLASNGAKLVFLCPSAIGHMQMDILFLFDCVAF
jgi:hypothetical protein